MKTFFIYLIFLLGLHSAGAGQYSESCSKWPSWFQGICRRSHQIWNEGNNELYVTGYAWHNRYTYPKHKLDSYNELAFGGGLGKGFYDEDGDWHGVFAIAFLDSHKNIEPAVGYAFLKVAHLGQNTRLGAGYTVLVTQRPDIFHGIPFPGLLPWLSFNYGHLSLLGTYIPGAKGAGNVVFILGKWTFDSL
ncbi:lipid IV(A) palmitoyltransferase PagP [Legionella jordanis]|uniref:Palmitoyl transferase for Lipid A n=1 Tax=Legionella jordanis TaxID=456 RepID=A0A0W0VCP6_9GAMM|nr:lipid IV(A) palmitoyltransferase PagP [Legionella jordanis]KTD17909.1 Palmitoyl transferase for Lipid A [Legionella jordanis]RMX02392.1 phospholipid:lipid A palmitoyltransferase [Legionella jordanis]RMX21766.1 phospholipid:lipid A palmitoyltransferase [Legionella jordanis]VEH14000.1 Rcp protein, confers resistance to cationic antimicrobial peptides and promotes intracellular infection [Legionella jordanis]HAT8713879.1 lipid IV(A) palmitoyltransferase PagP [Legionella jordanis]